MTQPSPPPDARRLAGDEGLTVIWVALLLVVLLMFAALAIDGGQAYQSHRQSQNASDSGAMAGVRVLEKLKFPPNPPSSYTSADIAAQALQQAHATGADTTTGGVACYLIDFNLSRQSGDICGGSSPSNAQIGASYGVEVAARQTKQTFFAGVGGFKSTKATTTAKALVYSFAGGTGSPFIVCGSRPSGSPASWAYDLIEKDSGVWQVKSSALNKYYAIQASQVPTCGAPSSKFDGLGSGQTITSLPTMTGVTPGNRNDANVSLTVAGITPCPTDGSQLTGCGMLIPIADYGQGPVSNPQMHVVMWTVWRVWEGQNDSDFPGSPSDPVGTSARNPISITNGSKKYRGQLLGGAYNVSGGNTGGAGTANAPRVLKLAT